MPSAMPGAQELGRDLLLVGESRIEAVDEDVRVDERRHAA